ncbi:hypothetical protein SUNI508_00913 [Seiridium unicorne]|uniref:Uncharacterized protein n=1 Tax=Seiridium unicorne TaxID=138068 RepID=A0ABR2V1V6_9PEZI
MKEPGDDLRLITRLMAEFLVLMHPIAYSPFAAFWRFVEKCLTDRTQMEADLEQTGSADNGRKDFFHYLFHAVDPETGKRGWMSSTAKPSP